LSDVQLAKIFSLSVGDLFNLETILFHHTSIQMATIKNTNNRKCW
jgi:hypothetical protein